MLRGWKTWAGVTSLMSPWSLERTSASAMSGSEISEGTASLVGGSIEVGSGGYAKEKKRISGISAKQKSFHIEELDSIDIIPKV